MAHLPSTSLFPSIWTTNDDAYLRELTFGSELVTNGDFSSALTGWAYDVGWTHVAAGAGSPYAKATGPLTSANLTQNLSVTSGGFYKVEFELVQPVSNNYQIQFSLGGHVHPWRGAFSGEGAKPYRFIMEASNSGGIGPTLGVNFKATIGSGSAIGIKNISVKEVLTSGEMISQWCEANVWVRAGDLVTIGQGGSPWSIGFG